MSLISCVNGVSTEVNRQWQIIFWKTNKNKTCVVTNYWKQCKSMTHSCTDLRPHTHVEQCVHPPGKRLEMELKKVGETVQPGPEHGQASTLTSNFFACSWHFLSCHLSIYPCLFLSNWPLPFPIPGLIISLAQGALLLHLSVSLVIPLGCKVILESPFHIYKAVGCLLLLGQPQGSICKSSSEDIGAAHASSLGSPCLRCSDCPSWSRDKRNHPLGWNQVVWFWGLERCETYL